MSKGDLYFSIDDTLLDEKIGLDNVSLPILKDLIEQFSAFIKGDNSVNLNEVKIEIKPGSVALVAEHSPLTESAVADYRTFKQSGDLSHISPIRAKVIASLQEKARKNPDRLYTISDETTKTSIKSNSVEISSETDFRVVHKDQWIDTETYLHGRVYDMGGKSKSNVHLTLSNGTSIKLGAEESLLADDSENRLYKDQLVRIKAQRNLRTKELRNERLVNFEYYEPSFDEIEFNNQVAKTKQAWQDVPDIVSWVEELRGNHAQAA